MLLHCWTWRKYRFSSLWYDATGNGILSHSFGGAYSNNCITPMDFHTDELLLDNYSKINVSGKDSISILPSTVFK